LVILLLDYNIISWFWSKKINGKTLHHVQRQSYFNFECQLKAQIDYSRLYYYVCSAHDSCDAIDLERTILKKLSNTGKLFLYMNKGFWSQFKTAGNAIYANKLYLSLYRHNHKLERLVSTIFDDTSIPSVLGDVRIDPSSTVHPTAVVSHVNE
jgi:NDP-sugar pyrophosphorylase family protein